MSKMLDIPWNTLKAIINKWRKCGTIVTLPRTDELIRRDENITEGYQETYDKMC